MGKQLQFELWEECGNGCKWCVPAGSKVILENGIRKNIEDVQLGDTILAYDDVFGKVVFTRVVNTSKRYIEEPIYRIETDKTTLYITKDHPILTYENNWVTVENLYKSNTNVCCVLEISKAECCMRTQYNTMKIEPVDFAGYVYNIQTVAESYIVNDIVVHNCYLGNNNKYTPEKVKLNSLKNAYDTICKEETYKDFDTVAYLGGEFFQGQLNTSKVKEEFFNLMNKSADLLRQNKLKEVWIYMTLTIGDQKDLYDTIKIFDGVTDKLWLLTSYDTMGRFHSPKMEENWKYHMKNIHKLYPEIRLNTTIILTSDCIKKYINGEISFRKLKEEYNTDVFFKQVGCDNESPRKYNEKRKIDFVPDRKTFINFLKLFKQQENEKDWDKLFNIQYRADVLYRNGNDLNHQMMKNIRHKDNRNAEIEFGFKNESSLELEIEPCGHLAVYHVYSDCDGCVMCDKEMLSDS